MGVLVSSTGPQTRSADRGLRRAVRPWHDVVKRTARSLWLQCAVLLAALWLYHLWISSLMQRGLLQLGAVSHKLAPLYAYWDPKLKGGLLLALAVLAGYRFFLRRVLCNDCRRLRDWKAVALLTLWMPLLAIAVAGIDGNLTRIARPFERTDIEYYGAVDRVGDLRTFIATYPQRAAEMPMHAQTHPPGAVLFLWAATRLVGDTPLRAALAAVFFSALSVPAVYLLARDLGGPSLARLSAALYLLMPGVVLFTATSMDGPFAVLLIWSIYLGWRSAWRGSMPAGFAAGVVLALAAWMTFSAAVAGLFVVLAVLLAAWRRARAETPAECATLVTSSSPVAGAWGGGVPTKVAFQCRRFVRSAAPPLLAVLAGGLAFYVPLCAATGYHPADMLGTAMSISAGLMGRTGHVSWSQHWHIATANLVVFFAFCGVPLTVLWMRETARRLRTGWSRSALGTLLVAFVAALAITDLLPLYSLETERIWIFLAPLVAIPAAAALLRAAPAADASLYSPQVRSVLLLLAAQAVLTELFLGTYW